MTANYAQRNAGSACVATHGLRIVQAIASVENPAAGTTYCVTRLSETLASMGHAVDLVSTGPPSEDVRGSLRIKSCAASFSGIPVLGRLRFSAEFAHEMARSAAAGALLHSNGLWLMPNVYPGRAARRSGVPLVVSPHGMLAEGALVFSPGKKRIFDALLQRRVLDAVTCFHATAAAEVEEIRAYGLKAPVALIPNGIDVPVAVDRVRKGSLPRTVLYLGRIHPKKGLDRLLVAWSRVEAAHPGWQLRIVGPGENGHDRELQAQANALGLTRVRFEEGVYGDAKAAAYRAADLFVLPTISENFAMVVAEALAAGTPVISTKGAPWGGLVEHRCGWWIDHGPEPLAAALTAAMALPPGELKEMGERGRMWMLSDFSWQRVASSMSDVYRWCLGRGNRPDTIAT